MSGINIPVTVTGADTAATQLGKVSTSLGGIQKASNTAGQSLTNLGRIAQDAPFGFIGIANNIDPLIESFGRLKAETGSTGGAFKALLSSLTGTGGIALAVSVATGVLTVLAQKGFFKTAEAADEAAKKSKEFQKTIESVQSSVASEQANILVLVKALDSETTSREKKAAALKQLQQINPQYFGDLKLEGNLVEGLGAAYQSYAASILASVQNKIDTKRLEDVLTRLNEAQEQQQRNQLLIKSNEAEIARLTALGGKQYVGNIQALNAQLGATDKIVKFERERDEILKRIASRNFEGTIKFGKTAENAEKTKKAIETVETTIAKLREKLAAIGKEEELFNVDKTKDKINELTQTIQTLFSKFKLDPSNSIVQQLNNEIKQLEAQQDRKIRFDVIVESVRLENIERSERLKKALEISQERLSKAIKPINIPFAVKFNKIQDFAKRAQEFGENASEIFKTTIADSFSKIGESIGNLITGDGGLGGLFAGIGQIFGDALKQLGKYVIETSVLVAKIKVALNAAFAGNPILGVLAGVALIALGTIIQNTLPKFANGVTNFGGGVALVGERGPELVRLPSGSDVIPNYRLNSLSASSPIGYIPNVTLRGSDLVIAFNRQTATNRRNG